MNKKQIIILWIGAVIFLFCLWNPEIVPNKHYKYRAYTDKEWNSSLSKNDLDLSVNESEESLRGKLSKKPEGEGTWDDAYKDMLIKEILNGKRPYGMFLDYTTHDELFNTDFTSLFARLLGVTVVTAVVIYTLGDKNKTIVKEILQSFARSKPNIEKGQKEIAGR